MRESPGNHLVTTILLAEHVQHKCVCVKIHACECGFCCVCVGGRGAATIDYTLLETKGQIKACTQISHRNGKLSSRNQYGNFPYGQKPEKTMRSTDI